MGWTMYRPIVFKTVGQLVLYTKAAFRVFPLLQCWILVTNGKFVLSVYNFVTFRQSFSIHLVLRSTSFRMKADHSYSMLQRDIMDFQIQCNQGQGGIQLRH